MTVEQGVRVGVHVHGTPSAACGCGLWQKSQMVIVGVYPCVHVVVTACVHSKPQSRWGIYSGDIKGDLTSRFTSH